MSENLCQNFKDGFCKTSGVSLKNLSKMVANRTGHSPAFELKKLKSHVQVIMKRDGVSQTSAERLAKKKAVSTTQALFPSFNTKWKRFMSGEYWK